MESLEISGKTVEEAIEHALQKLGVSREKVKITVLKEGKSGILGIGAGEAQILVEPVTSTPEKQDSTVLAKRVLEELLQLMGFQTKVVPAKSFVGDDENLSPLTFNITGDDDVGILIGRHGQTMASLQYLVRIILTRRIQDSPQSRTGITIF